MQWPAEATCGWRCGRPSLNRGHQSKDLQPIKSHHQRSFSNHKPTAKGFFSNHKPTAKESNHSENTNISNLQGNKGCGKKNIHHFFFLFFKKKLKPKSKTLDHPLPQTAAPGVPYIIRRFYKTAPQQLHITN